MRGRLKSFIIAYHPSTVVYSVLTYITCKEKYVEFWGLLKNLFFLLNIANVHP